MSIMKWLVWGGLLQSNSNGNSDTLLSLFSYLLLLEKQLLLETVFFRKKKSSLSLCIYFVPGIMLRAYVHNLI